MIKYTSINTLRGWKLAAGIGKDLESRLETEFCKCMLTDTHVQGNKS